MTKKKLKCFVMMPFAGEFNDIYQYGIKPAAQDCGYLCYRADELTGTGSILKQIIENIFSSDLIIVDVSKANPNVFYELGIAHALGKPVIIISRTIEDVPFDIRSYRVITYKNIKGLQDYLKKAILDIKNAPSPDSPVLDAVPEVDTVPRVEFTNLKKEINSLRAALGSKEAEIEALKSSVGQSPEILTLRDEIKQYLKTLTEDVISASEEKLVAARIEIERLKSENQILQSAQLEVRKLKQMTLVNPHWKGRDFDIDQELCFLLMPFREPWSNDVWNLIKGIVKRAGFRCERADERDGRVVMDDIWEGICKSRLVIADLTSKNSNVTYEVGLADVLGKEVVLLSQTPDDVPFDFLGLRLITYENSIGGVQKLSEELEKRLEKLRR